MAVRAKKTDPALWDRVKKAVARGEKGGKSGQWSARKAQLAVREYKQQGGGYSGGKDGDNHLRQWTEEQWGTKSGAPSGKTGERYLPKRAREHLTEQEYAKTTAKKRDDTRKGKQFSAQPSAIARKTAGDRAVAGADMSKVGTGKAHMGNLGTGVGRAHPRELKRTELLAQAARAGITGRSKMSKEQLIEALD